MQYVEYIQNGEGTSRSTGWAIPLNYHPSITTDVRMVVKFDNVGNDGYLLVGSMNGDGNFFRLFSYMVRTMTFDCPNDSSARLSMAWNGLTEMEMGVDSNGAYYLRNLTTSQTATGTSSFQRVFSSDFYLFNDGRGGDCFQGQKIYYIEIYENGTKVKDYRPAKDNNNVVCLYETIGHTYHYCGKTLIAGPSLSSIAAEASKTSLAASGETINIVVDCNNAWTVTGNTFLSLSSTGDTGSTTITATAPSYTGATARLDTLTFTDSVTGDEAEITITQKKYRSPAIGQPVYLGGDEITELYLGEDAISEAYLGDVLVFSSGPFAGLRITPKEISFNTTSLTSQVKVKSSEAWSMALPAWVSASQTTGDTGETIVTLTATTQTATTTGTVSVTTTNYSASADVTFYNVEYGGYLQISGPANIQTDFNPYVEYGKNNYLRLEINADYTAQGFMYAAGNANPWWFTYEYGRFGQYFNAANKTGLCNGINTTGMSTTLVVTMDNGNASNSLGETNTFGGSMPNDVLTFCRTDAAQNIGVNFYRMKIYNNVNSLAYDFVAAEYMSQPVIYDLVGGVAYYPQGGSVTYVCNTECQCVNAGGQWINNECVYPTPTPTGKTLTINSVAIANSMGETVSINVQNNGTGYLTYDSIFDDSRGEADNTFSVGTGYTYTFDDENGVITFTGPFDLAGGYEVTCERSDPNMGTCESVHNSFPVVWTGDAATVNADFAALIDPECECMEQGGTWDVENEECMYPEDPCGGDPCCEQGISDPDECGCMMTGGWWDGSECHYD